MASSAPRRSLAFSVALVCAALVLASCHGSSKHTGSSTTSGVPTTNAKGKPTVSLALTIGKLSVQAAGSPARPFDTAAAKNVRALVNNYITRAMVTPLFTGKDSAGLVAYFAPTLLQRVGPNGHDRAALTDEHEPVITSVTKTVKAPLNLVALQDHGRTVMIGAQFGLTVHGSTAQGPFTVSRVGNFVFEANLHNVWSISGYDIVVHRTIGSTSTTQKATTTTAAK